MKTHKDVILKTTSSGIGRPKMNISTDNTDSSKAIHHSPCIKYLMFDKLAFWLFDDKQTDVYAHVTFSEHRFVLEIENI